MLSRFEFPNGAVYSHLMDRNGYLSTYFGKVQFRLGADKRTIDATVAPDVEMDWVKILMAASYPAFLLFLQARVPLHASAVWLPGLKGAVGVLGGPGAGKTTLAGALCLAGGTLISDDLLSLEVIPAKAGIQSLSEPRASLLCQPGSRELRLRQGSDELAARFTSERVTASPDGRCLVDAREDLPAELPLKALLQAVLDRQATEVRLERLSGTAAFQAVAGDPRIKGLVEPTWIRNAFEHAARLAREVPVYRATVPFRERNFGEIGRSLTATLRRSLA